MSKSKGEGDIESGSSQASSVFNTGADSAQLPPQITAQLAARAAAQTRPRLRRHGTSRSGAGGKSSTRLQYEELQDLVQDLPVDQHKQVIASQSSSGYLADYIERRKASEGKWKLSNERWLYYYIHSKPKTFFGEAARHAKGLLLREQLECDLMSSIVLERKKEKVMPATGLKEFVAQAQNILTMKRTLGTIRASVWNWELNVRLLEFGYRGDQDLVLTRMADRRWRNESFWSMFHDRARDHRPEEKEAFDELPEEGLQAYHTLSRFNQTVQQQLWSSQHGCPGSNTKATGPAQRLPVDMSREHQNVSDQRPSTLRWVPPPRPQSAVSGSRSALRRCQTTPNLREHVRPASAGSTAKRESHLGLADGRFFRRTIGSAAQSLPILEKPRVIASDRKDMLRSISSRPTSAGSSRGNVKRPSSAGSWATASRPQSAVSRRRTKEWKMPETEPTPSLWSPADPWPASPQRGKSRHQAPPSCQKYLQACQLHATVPDTLDFNTGLSDKLSAPRRYICDADLLAVAGMLPARDHVDAVDLQENSNLTDLSLVPLLEQFVKVDRLAEGLRRLNLKYCKGINWLGQETLLRLMSSAKNLRELDLSGVPIGMRVQRRLCVAVGDHPHLMSIGLARVGLGGHMLTKDCLHSLLGSQSNQRLDLSWNVFNKQEFQLVGDFIAENLVLEHLLLDHCAGYIAREDTPISHLVEKLAFNHALRSLSVCTDRIDSRAALVIEDSLEGHPTLKRLYLRNDPLGIMGLRSILRLLCREESHLSRLDIEGCHGGKSGDEVICLEGSAAQESKVFSFTNPGGKYVLDLSIPYDRSLCRMLYETAERFELKHSKAFVNINYSIPPYQHPIRDSIGQYKVRREGILTFTFNVESAIAAKWSEIADDDFITFLNAHLELMRFTPHRIKMRPLLANWKAISGMPMEQETFLTALASDFNMILPYLEYMVQACPEAGTQTLFRLIPSLKRDGSSMYLATALFPEMEDFLVTVREMEAYMLFNPQNPTGHYKLKLENSTDFAVAQQLLLLDRWESVVNKRNRRQDVSQRGNQSQLRNECHMGRSLHLSVKMLTEWVIPEFGEFECDYVTSNHPKKGSKPLSDDLWEELMMCMYDSPCEPQDRLKVLKTISHQIFLSSLHIRQMVGFFRNDLDREDALVFFWPRVVDKYNAKVFRVRFEKQEDVVRLQERLGYASFFPFIQPENAKFRYNMAVYEQRLAASLIVTLAQRENPGNIKGYNASENLPTFERPDGTFDPLTMGVPRSWADFKQCPTKGIFSGSYKCAPENRDYEFRRRLAETYGYYDSKIMASTREQDIMWWTGLMEPPEDILDLLEFLISRFQNVDEAFRKIVRISDTKSEQITLRVFSDGLKAMDCGKFKGEDENKRLQAIFRYLDPGGEGTVSLNEWRVLGQLWSEFDMTIREFVQFLIIAFGEDLKEAWNALDDDGSGELSEDEWFEAVEKIGYFGPARVIFALLDNTDDGDISAEEFEVLEKYKKTRR